MSVTNVSADTGTLESSLKEILDKVEMSLSHLVIHIKVLNYAEKFFVTQEDLAILESKLNDYDNLLELTVILKDIFGCLIEKVDEKLSAIGHENYDELEKTVQKHEGEIRNHIRV